MSENLEHPNPPTTLPTDTLVESVVMLLALTVVQRLVGFVRAVLFCRWLAPEQLGLWDMAFSFLLLAAPLAVLAIPGAFGRYLEYYRHRGHLRTFLRWTVSVCGGLMIVALTTVLLLRHWLADVVFGDSGQSDLVALAAMCLATVILYNVLIELFTALRNIRLVSVMQMVNSFLFAVLGLGLLATYECSARSVLLAYGGSCLIAAVWAGWRLPHVWRAATPAAHTVPLMSLWRKVAPYALWVLMANVLSNLFEVIDRYMIVHFSQTTPAEALDLVGNYHSSRVVPMLLVSIAAMFSAMMMPHLSHDWESGRRDLVAARLRLFLKMFGFALFAAAVAVSIASPLLFGMAFRNKFPGGEAVLPWTLVYCIWFGLSMIVQDYLMCAERAPLASVALGCGLALNVALNIVLLPRLGLEGAVLATAAANAVLLMLICRLTRHFGLLLDDGVYLVFALPMLVCLSPWVALLVGLVVAIDALWADRLLTPDEKRHIFDGFRQCAARLGLTRPTKRPRPW